MYRLHNVSTDKMIFAFVSVHITIPNAFFFAVLHSFIARCGAYQTQHQQNSRFVWIRGPSNTKTSNVCQKNFASLQSYELRCDERAEINRWKLVLSSLFSCTDRFDQSSFDFCATENGHYIYYQHLHARAHHPTTRLYQITNLHGFMRINKYLSSHHSNGL